MLRCSYIKSYLQLFGLKSYSYLIFKTLNLYGLCPYASSVKTECWGIIWNPQRSSQWCPLLLACYCSAIVLWVIYIYILSLYFCKPKFIWNVSCAFLPVSLWCLVVSFLLCFEALFCCVLCCMLYPCSLWCSCGRVLMSNHNVKHTVLVIVFFYALLFLN
jgi:hypothetical protein